MKSETLRYGEGKKKRKKEREEKREENTFRFDWSGKRLHDRCELETKPFLVRDNTNPGRHCAIKETGIEHRLPFTLSLSRSLSPSPFNRATGRFTFGECTKVARSRLLGPSQSEDINNKI